MSLPRPFDLRPLAAAGLVATALLGGCAGVPPPALPGRVPGAWSAEAAAPAAAAADLRNWWRGFGDAQLDALVDEALRANLDLAQATSRLRQARLLAQVDGARFRPSASFFVRPVRDAQAVDSYLHSGIDATWELGLFGASEANAQSADGRWQSAAWAEQGARVSLVAEVVRRYVELRAAQQQALAQGEAAAIDQRAAELAAVRVRTHIGAQADLAQASLQAAQSRAARVQQEQAARQAAQSLALLTGRDRPDAAWMAPRPVPTMPALRVGVVPAELLRTRPDVRLAEAGVLRAAGEAGLARAELYPRIGLAGGLLFSYNLTQHRRTISDSVLGIGPVIDIPLFDWNRRRNRADAGEEALNEAVLGYRKAVLEGVADVENALSLLEAQRERERLLGEAATLLQRQGEQQRARTGAGLSSEHDGVVVERAGKRNALELADARAGHALALVALYKSLGGAPLPAPDAAGVQP